ncbi:MAG: SPOR domain-containing protein [Prolixibacteraceae bacterium]|jgi:hypothetical protein|nr:SPOR domain-containing protein [Prolixibacteraceae bacterium]
MQLEEKELIEARKELREKAIINEMNRLQSNNSTLSKRYKFLLFTLLGFVVSFLVILFYLKDPIIADLKYKKNIKEQPIEVLSHKFDDIYFRIQIGSYITPHSELLKSFSGEEVEEIKDSRYRYFIGRYSTLGEANRMVEKIKSQGYSDAFIVPFDSGNFVEWTQVWKILNDAEV